MTAFSQMLVVLAIYRVIIILTGLAFAFLGYKLFCRGVYDKAGDLKAAWGEKRLVIKQAAPGTFFALFGVAVVAIALWRGIEFEYDKIRSTIPLSSEFQIPSTLRFFAAPSIDKPVVAVLEKASKGAILTEQERKMLSEWLQAAQEHERIRGVAQGEMPGWYKKYLQGG